MTSISILSTPASNVVEAVRNDTATAKSPTVQPGGLNVSVAMNENCLALTEGEESEEWEGEV